MPLKINYLDDGIGVEYVSTGVLTGEEIIEANKELYASEAFRHIKYKIIDRTRCTEYRVTAEDMKFFARQNLEAAKINKEFMILVISTTQLQYGMTRMWEVYVEDSGLRTENFKDRESANQFIEQFFKKHN